MDLITYALCRKLIKRAIESLGDVFTLKGNVASVDALPTTGNNPGDIYLVGPNDTNTYDEYYWTSDGEWENMGSTITFDGLITEEALYKGEDGTGTIQSPAQDTILAVVNGQHVLKSGDTMTGMLTTPLLTVGSRTIGTHGTNSVAEGTDVSASGHNSHAEGANTVASGTDSHAEGCATQATNYYSHAEGYGTKATGSASHAEGDNTKASGEDSHAEGAGSIASGHRSHAEGQETIAQRASQNVTGEFNIADTTGSSTTSKGAYVQIVGNGTANNNRSNAYTLDWNGNAWFAGDIYVSSTSGTNKDAGSKKVVTEDIISRAITPNEINEIFIN